METVLDQIREITGSEVEIYPSCRETTTQEAIKKIEGYYGRFYESLAGSAKEKEFPPNLSLYKEELSHHLNGQELQFCNHELESENPFFWASAMSFHKWDGEESFTMIFYEEYVE